MLTGSGAEFLAEIGVSDFPKLQIPAAQMDFV
jgi:hypothetical protein